MGFGYAVVNDFLLGTLADKILNISQTNACFKLLHFRFPGRV